MEKKKKQIEEDHLQIISKNLKKSWKKIKKIKYEIFVIQDMSDVSKGSKRKPSISIKNTKMIEAFN